MRFDICSNSIVYHELREGTIMSDGNFLSREAILSVADITVEQVAVPEWGGMVRVKGLTGAERDRFEAVLLQDKKRPNRLEAYVNFRARLVVLSVVDENGNRLFTDKDVAALGAKSAQALERVYQVASRLAGLNNEDVEELTKNSESDQSDDSTRT